MIDGNLTIGIIISAALADSINPCVFGVLIFLLAFMTRVFKTRRRMLIGGLFYSFVVYVTYLVLGFGILKVAISTGFSAGFYWIAAVIAILAGLLEIKDFFWYGKGFSLQMIPGASKRIKAYTNKLETLNLTHPNWTMMFIGFLGVFVVLVELPCTGAPYFAVLALLASGSYVEAIPMLLLYNFIFVAPLLVTVAIAYFGKNEAMEAWRMKHRGMMRLVVGLLLVALGAYMIYSVLP